MLMVSVNVQLQISRDVFVCGEICTQIYGKNVHNLWK